METRQFIVKEGEQGGRLDLWLKAKMPEFSRGQIKHLLDQGKILVNHRRVLIAGWELRPEDRVEVRFPLLGVPAVEEESEQTHLRQSRGQQVRQQTGNSILQQARHSIGRGREFPLNVLFEDRDIIVVEKPAGVLTEPKHDSPHPHLLGMIRNYMKRRYQESKGSFVKLLHRLDKDTSGVLVAAKSKVGEQLEEQFRSHRVERHYLALVEGRVEKEEGTIDLPIEKGDFHGGRKVRVVAEGAGGMKALTRFRVQERYANVTLVAVQVSTGRTHQVRVHFAELGHPLVGDAVYGGKIPFARHALHASFLGFQHPRTKKSISFETKPPADFLTLIDDLRGG